MEIALTSLYGSFPGSGLSFEFERGLSNKLMNIHNVPCDLRSIATFHRLNPMVLSVHTNQNKFYCSCSDNNIPSNCQIDQMYSNLRYHTLKCMDREVTYLS